METSGWDIALSISTVVLAVATVALAAAAIVAGIVAVRELREVKTATKQTGKLADVDIRRRRAEVSQYALRRFMGLYDQQHPVMLGAARAVTAEREAARTDPNQVIVRCRIPELLTEQAITSHDTSDDMLDALQNCLDGLEEIGLGVELGVYDKYVLYHGAFSRIDQLVDWGRPYIELSRKGKIPHRDAQHTAFEQCLALQRRLREIREEGAPTKLAGALDEGSAEEESGEAAERPDPHEIAKGHRKRLGAKG